MYKELKIEELTTGQLASAYQKVEKSLSRVAGGCWEFKNNKTTNAVNHRLHISSIKHIDRPADIEAVRTIDLIRHKHGFRIEQHSGYEMSCHNDRCFNPAHQVRPRTSWAKKPWSPEDVERSGLLRRNGWSTHYQRTEYGDACYISAKKEAKYNPIVPITLPSIINLATVNKIFELFTIEGELPSIDAMMAHTGLTFEQILPYGYAVAAIEQRSKSVERRDACGAMLRGFLEEKTVREIAAENAISPATIHTFRGALYG